MSEEMADAPSETIMLVAAAKKHYFVESDGGLFLINLQGLPPTTE